MSSCHSWSRPSGTSASLMGVDLHIQTNLWDIFLHAATCRHSERRYQTARKCVCASVAPEEAIKHNLQREDEKGEKAWTWERKYHVRGPGSDCRRWKCRRPWWWPTPRWVWVWAPWPLMIHTPGKHHSPKRTPKNQKHESTGSGDFSYSECKSFCLFHRQNLWWW